MILLINRDNLFNEDDIKNLEMVEYENYKEDTLYIEREAFRHFEMLKAHLKVDGIVIDISSAYRSLEKQESIFLDYMKRYGIDEADELVAMPGTSDHHTGQAIDIVIMKDGSFIEEREELLKEEEVFKKIHQSLKYFGFIVRYPKDKEEITGFTYRPWHLRYIGEDDALKINDLTLEEYLLDRDKLTT